MNDPAAQPPLGETEISQFDEYGPTERQPIGRIQQIVGRTMVRNWSTIPHVTHHDEADITALEKYRVELNRNNGSRVTPLSFLVKAAVAALRASPQFNASLEPDGRHLVLKHYFHIGFAVDTPNGLLVPVIRDADRKSIVEIAQEIAEVSARARTKGLPVAEMSGGCFTVSSLGSIGGTGFTPIINAPELAVLGVAMAKWQPQRANEEGDLSWRQMLPLSLSYDHRVINGAAAALFTRSLAHALERPDDLSQGS